MKCSIYSLSRHLIFLLAILGFTLLSTIALAQTQDSQSIEGERGMRYVIGDRQLTTIGAEEEETIRIPCSGPATLHTQTLLVGCGTRGILLISVADPTLPEPLEILPVEGEIADIYLVRDQVWIELADGSARQFEYDAPAPEPDVEPETEPAEKVEEVEEVEEEVEVEIEIEEPREPLVPEVTGRVIEVKSGVAVIDLGRDHGLTEDMRIQLYRVRDVSLGSEQAQREDPIATEVISTLANQNSEINLPLNITVDEGVLARPTTGPITRHQTPPAVRDLMVFKTTLRPFLPIGALGIGMIADASVGYRFSSPLAIDLKLSPLGFTLSNRDDVVSLGGHAIFSYASDKFQVGLGVGVLNTALTVNSGFVEASEPPTEGVRIGAVQHARLGATEGNHAGLTTQFVVIDGGWAFGGASLELQHPTRLLGRDNLWIQARAEGSASGNALMEVGIRTLVAGNGGPGSLFISPSIGYGAVFNAQYDACTQEVYDSPQPRSASGYCYSEVVRSGPLIGFGVEWRN